MGDAHRRAALELGTVGDQHHATGVGDDRLRHLHLAIVEIQQRALLVDRGGADDGIIHLELADQADGAGADDRAVGAADIAARHDHLDTRMAIELHRHVEVVGDDEQVFMRGERARDLLGGGSDVDEQRAAVRNLRRGRHPDRLLLVGSDKAAGFVGKIFNARRDDGAAVDTGQRALVAEVVEVLADGLGGHLEAPGEIVHHDPAERAGDVQNIRLTLGKPGHFSTLTTSMGVYGADVRGRGQRTIDGPFGSKRQKADRGKAAGGRLRRLTLLCEPDRGALRIAGAAKDFAVERIEPARR